MDNSLEIIELKRIIETLELIYSGEITIEEGEKRCFSPKNAIRLEKEQCNQRIVDLIWECCELENIESLIPHKFKKNVRYLRKTAIRLQKDLLRND